VLKTEIDLAKLDQVAISQGDQRLHRAVIDAGTITAAEIFQLNLFTVNSNHCMMATDRIQWQDNLAIGVTADGCPSLLEFEYASCV
jgi:hypothetical protein